MAKIAAVLSLACLVGIALAFPKDSGIVRDSLFRKFQTQEQVDIVVTLTEGISKAVAQIEGKSFASRSAKITSLRSALVANAEESQRSLNQLLQSRAMTQKNFWITNKIVVKNASIDLVQDLANHADVAEVREMISFPVAELKRSSIDVHLHQGRNQWGIEKVKAHTFWDSATRGENIIVSSVDTGVRGTHRILKDNFIGDFGWYSPALKNAAPADQNGHGTHTMGTIAGQEGYGVAPGAKWMSCQGCAGSACAEDDLLDCGQFIFCPHDTQGNNPDCSKAPHLVSNSWGSTVGDDPWYDDVIANWHQAGIIPIFSAGNAGPFCETVGSPGDRDAIAVGATDIDDALAYFSSVGPSWSGEQKPEISAPGYDILSSYMTNDNSFESLSGTSMACPHVAGAVALLMSANPALQGDYQEVRRVLFGGAEQEGLEGMGENCGGVNENVFPNYAFGWGRLDVVKASQSLRNMTIF